MGGPIATDEWVGLLASPTWPAPYESDEAALAAVIACPTRDEFGEPADEVVPELAPPIRFLVKRKTG